MIRYKIIKTNENDKIGMIKMNKIVKSEQDNNRIMNEILNN